MSTQILITKVEEAFGFHTFSILGSAGGFSAKNLECTGDEELYVLKCFSGKSLDAVQNIIDIAAHFKSGGLPVISPVAAKGGHKIVSVPDEQRGGLVLCTLYPWCDGGQYHEPTLTKLHRVSAAKLLAQVHQVPHHESFIRLNLHDKVKSALEELLVLHEKALLSEHREVIVPLFERKKRVLNNFKGFSTSLPFLTIHGDYHNENLLFDPEGNVEALLDFEDAQLSHPFQDVMTFVSLACSNTSFSEQNLEWAKEFVSVYREETGYSYDTFFDGFSAFLTSFCASFFLEKLVLDGRDDIIKLLERDSRKLDYFNGREEEFTQKLWSS